MSIFIVKIIISIIISIGYNFTNMTTFYHRSTGLDLITVPPTKFKLCHLIGRCGLFVAFTSSEINSAHGHVKSLDGRDKSHSNKEFLKKRSKN